MVQQAARRTSPVHAIGCICKGVRRLVRIKRYSCALVSPQYPRLCLKMPLRRPLPFLFLFVLFSKQSIIKELVSRRSSLFFPRLPPLPDFFILVLELCSCLG